VSQTRNSGVAGRSRVERMGVGTKQTDSTSWFTQGAGHDEAESGRVETSAGSDLFANKMS
jgi:hypothetical protein